MNRTTLHRLFWSALVSMSLVALLLHLVSGAGNQDKYPGLWQILTNTSLALVATYAMLALGQAWVRSVRYRLLLHAAGVAEVPSGYHMMLVTMARNMFVDMLPSRSGELMYVALLNRGYRVPVPDGLSSLALSFVFDLVALALLVGALLLHAAATASAPAWMGWAMAFIAVVSLTGLAVLLFGSTWAGQLMHRWTDQRALPRWMEKVKAFLDRLIRSFEAVRRSGTLLRTLALSVVVRSLKYGGIYLLFLAVTRANFPELTDAGFVRVLSALLGAEAAASLPLPTLMSFGAYEAGGTAVWTMLGFSAAASALAMLAIHLWSQAVDYLVGGAGLLLIAVRRAGNAPAVTAPVSSPRWRLAAWALVALAVLAVASGWAFLEYRAFKKLGALEAPDIGSAVTVDTEAARPAWAADLQGFIVWSSNRDGNHDIFRMALPEGTVMPLTRHPHTEYYPRISPDGARLLFCRSQIPWVSQRNKVPWDLYLLDLASGKETLIATNANVPAWINDREILFQFNGTEVRKRDLVSGEETRLLYPGLGDIPENLTLDTPSYNPHTGEIGLSIRPVRQTSALADREGRLRPFGHGCQVNWTPDYTTLYYVDHLPGKDNAFFRVDPRSFERTLWFNHASPFNHEYFPRVTPDEAYLVFGASAGGHEHDAADYEIFLWKVGSPMDQTFRITWHTGNDCWPDIWLAR